MKVKLENNLEKVNGTALESEKLKSEVQEFWNNETCGTFVTNQEQFSKEYFEEIEKERYRMQPEIPIFAEFDKFKGKKMLEVGVGAGTDFLQWVRGGAIAHGIDLTQKAIDHVEHRLSLYGLKAEEFKVADCENLPYSDNYFDVVYSWGVIHHTPNTPQALYEIIRVLKPGGKAKIMIYHRHSVLTYLFWVKHALLAGKPWKSLAWVLWYKMESIGTKAYTVSEVEELLKSKPVKNVKIKAILSYYDKLLRFNKIMQLAAKILAGMLGGDKAGWFLTIEFEKSK